MPGNVRTVIEASGPSLGPTVREPAPPGALSDEQHALLKEGVLLVVEVPLPRNPKKSIGLHAISRQDQILARAQARLSARIFCNCEKPEEQPIPDVEDMCFRDEIVQRAYCVWPVQEEPVPLFSSVEDLRTKLSVAEIEALYEMHARHESWVCPLMRAEMTGADAIFESLLADLKKKPPSEWTDWLTRLPHATLAVWLASMAGAAPRT